MGRKGQRASEFERTLLRGMEEAVAGARGVANPTRMYTVGRLKASEQSISRPPTYTKERIIAIRKRMGVSQPIFADVLNVSTPTVRGWEQGVREPEGPSLRLLELAEREPVMLLELSGIRGAVRAAAKKSSSRRASPAKRPAALVRSK
ncbi:MAG: helix-turn-helix domain-containing protein [Gemmatimonadaceae bacterium]